MVHCQSKKERCICEQRCLHAIYVLLLLCSCKPYVRTMCIIYMVEHAIVLLYSTTIFTNIIYIYIIYSCTRTRLHTNTIKYNKIHQFHLNTTAKIVSCFLLGCLRPSLKEMLLYLLLGVSTTRVSSYTLSSLSSTCAVDMFPDSWFQQLVPCKGMSREWFLRGTHIGPNFQDAISISCPLGLYIYTFFKHLST